jgi:hypothetical protein
MPCGSATGSLAPLVFLLPSMHSSQELGTKEARNGDVTSFLLPRLLNSLLYIFVTFSESRLIAAKDGMAGKELGRIWEEVVALYEGKYSCSCDRP